MVALAVDLAEKQIREGTASSQVITHFLKIGTEREKLERERIARENDLLRAKIDAADSQKRVETLYSEAIKAFRKYNGEEVDDDQEP